MLIPYPGSEVVHPGSRVKKIPVIHQRIYVFLPKKIGDLLSEISIPDPDFFPSRNRIPDPGIKKALDPGSRSATLEIPVSHYDFLTYSFDSNVYFNSLQENSK
jgi:hypothetical protein